MELYENQILLPSFQELLGAVVDWSQVEGIGTPQDSANKREVFAQNSVPTSGYQSGDLWIDTDDDNHVYRANDDLAWVSVRDGSILSLSDAPGFPSDTNLVGYWSFDEGQGDIAFDLSGNGYHGTIIGSPAFVPGVSGTCLNLITNQYVNCGDESAFELTSALGIVFSVNFNSVSGTQALFNKRQNSGGYFVRLEGGKIQFYIYTASGWVLKQSTTAPAINTEYNIAASYSKAETDEIVYQWRRGGDGNG